MCLSDKTILITGGTGSFGKKFIDIALKKYNPKKLIVFSRDELKQHEMRQAYPDGSDQKMRYFIGNVRDRERLYRAFQGVDVVVHAAALKQVPACEYNPIEAVQTNIMGAKNVIDAAIDQNVKHVIAISTDKAVNPVNLYGATKLCAEKLFVQGNSYSGEDGTKFSCARYGNVVGSRGSVIPILKSQRQNGKITLTDERMNRFWITLDQVIHFVIQCLEYMRGGEIFVPKIPSMKIIDLARAIAPDCKVEYIGIRPGEKLHEVLVSEEEARQTVELDNMYIIESMYKWWGNGNHRQKAKSLEDGFIYDSSTNESWLSENEIKELVNMN